MADKLSHWEIANAEIPWERSGAFQRLASEAAQAAQDQQLPTCQFRDAVQQLYDAYGDFLYAMNPSKVEPEDYRHWYNHFRDLRLGKKLGEPPISQEILSSAASKYLKGALRVPLLDRGLLDAFIAQEGFAYVDRHAGRGAVLTQFGCLGVSLAVFAISGFIFGEGGTDWSRFGYVLAGLLAVYLVAWAWPKRGAFALHRAMKDTYQLLTGSVVSVPELRRRVDHARSQGVVWPAELYAVLDDVEGRTKVL